MRIPRISLALVALLALLALTWTSASSAQSAPAVPRLRVIRASPTSNANPLAQVLVTFDRPVAGSLDRSVDPSTVVSVEPAIAGRLEWRDPVTVRLVPSTPLEPGRSYAVTVSTDFRAMDGGALAEPYRFTFRVQGPTLLRGTPASPGTSRAEQIATDQRFELVYSAPVDLAALSAATYLEFNAACFPSRIVRLRAAEQRRVPTMRFSDEEDAGPSANSRLDSLQRAVQLVAAEPLPHGCDGDLVAPVEIGEPSKGLARMPVATYGDFRIAELLCNPNQPCPRGPMHVRFTTPVRGAEVLRHTRFAPDVKVIVRDTTSESTVWTLEGNFKPRVAYAFIADTAIRDVFGQSLRGNPAAGFRTTGVPPLVAYSFGHVAVERLGFRTLSVQHVNVDTLIAYVAPVPDSLEAAVSSQFGWSRDSIWKTIMGGVAPQRIPVRSPQDVAIHTGVHLPPPDARRPGAPTLYVVKVSGRAAGADVATDGPVAIAQVTNLGVHARIGAADGAVWVTGANDGLPRAGATVVLFDNHGRALASARTDSRGLARLTGYRVPADTSAEGVNGTGESYVKVTLGDDHAIASVSRFDADLAPWRFNVSSAWGDDRLPVAGAVFTERGIYRPGERVYAKAIVRDGLLGALRVPPAGDSIKWRVQDAEGTSMQEATMRLTSFGTASRSFAVPPAAAVGQYAIDVQVKRLGRWRSVARTGYRVAEYRPPEFLVNATAETSAPRFPGDTFSVVVQSRYLFGAPMGRAAVGWRARQTTVWPWELSIPGTDGWYVGESENWWESDAAESDREFASGADTLDARGERTLRVALPPPVKGRAAHVTVSAVVTDVNRQTVMASASTLVHPADFYVAAKPRGESYFWKAGTPQAVDVIAVRPTGERVSGVRVRGTVARHEWHQVRRERDGMSELVGDWVTDTVATCDVVTAATPGECAFTPRDGGEYTVTFAAADGRGRPVSTSFGRWASGTDWVPWNDETQFKMDVIPDKARYAVGDTATVLFASPFVDAEAWVTVEREGILEQRRLRITSGSTTLKFPITEAFAPNAYVSILVARGRSAAPGPLDDPGRPTIRVGYADLRVTPEVKRLTVTVAGAKTEYRPGDVARMNVQVRDAKGRGQRSEVTLWAVDEGVLSLTGYKTPDPIDLIYRERGLGVRLASNMSSVAPQVPDGVKGRREPGGGGGAAGADVLRSRFQTTAFFLGSVVTNAQGNAVATAKLPDNLTTFRLMAVAVTTTDRYGKGESSLLVTRPLLARQALPRFMRPGDRFTAGAVINRRDGAAVPVTVRATSTGATLSGESERTVTLEASRGAEVRFPFVAQRADSGTFRFDVTGGGDADAVRVSLPVRPDYNPTVHAIAGAVRDTATVEIALPADIDPARSRLSVSAGVSPLPMIRGMARTLHVYPYYCSEQVVSAALPIIALYRLDRQSDQHVLDGDPRADITRAVDMLSRRQRSDGAIGYWSPSDWSSAWLSAYAGNMLLDARSAGVKVDSAVLVRLADYVRGILHATTAPTPSPISRWQETRYVQLGDKVAAVDFLSRFGRPDVAAENELLRTASLLSLEDRARLAEVLARGTHLAAARQLMTPTWAVIQVEGRRAVLPDSAHEDFYFTSYVRPIARLLTATLAVDPQNALVGPLVETLVLQARAGRAGWTWNTQDYGSAITALAAFDRLRRSQPERTVRLRLRDHTVLAAGAARDSSIALTGLLADAAGGRVLRASLDAGRGENAVYYYLAVTEVPSRPPTTPQDQGVRVERWYERYDTGRPVTTVAEGDLVRVRLRVTVSALRQFLVLDDPLPAGLEAIDLSLRTASAQPGPGVAEPPESSDHAEQDPTVQPRWSYGWWDSGWWSPFDHRELRDDRVVYAATMLWPGTYTATYLARATTPGTFIKPPAHAEEMYNPGVNGRSDGGTFVVTARGSR